MKKLSPVATVAKTTVRRRALLNAMSSRKYRGQIGHVDMKLLSLAGPLHQIVQPRVGASWNAATHVLASVVSVVWDGFTRAVWRNVNAICCALTSARSVATFRAHRALEAAKIVASTVNVTKRAKSYARHVVIRARGNVGITSVTSAVMKYATDRDVT